MARKMTKAEAGRLGGKATYRKYGPDHMSRIGARGFERYAEIHHGGCAERAAFALDKAGRMAAFKDWTPPTFSGASVRCATCGREIKSYCPTCDPIPF